MNDTRHAKLSEAEIKFCLLVYTFHGEPLPALKANDPTRPWERPEDAGYIEPDGRGGWVPTDKLRAAVTAGFAAQQQPVDVSIKTMRKSGDAADYFVAFRCDGREVTPHVFTDQFKSEYHVALYRWLFHGGKKPDLMAFNDDDWPARDTSNVPLQMPAQTVLEAAVNLRDLWKKPGQKLDDASFIEAIDRVCDAAGLVETREALSLSDAGPIVQITMLTREQRDALVLAIAYLHNDLVQLAKDVGDTSAPRLTATMKLLTALFLDLGGNPNDLVGSATSPTLEANQQIYQDRDTRERVLQMVRDIAGYQPD